MIVKRRNRRRKRRNRGPKAKGVPLTWSVPEAGRKCYGLGRNGSYEAGKRGDLITIRVGRLLRVPVQAQMRKLEAAE